MGNTELEIWKDVIGFEGLYQVSNMGRVKSLGNNMAKKERILKQGKDRYGYYIVGLCREGKVKMCPIHRLVATHFLLNPNNYPCVNHKDENKQNNCISNLEFCTYQYNNTYGTRLERIAKANSISLQKPIVQIHKSGLIIGVYDSTIQASEVLGVSRSNICMCLKGKSNSAGGFKFKYLNELEKKASFLTCLF